MRASVVTPCPFVHDCTSCPAHHIPQMFSLSLRQAPQNFQDVEKWRIDKSKFTDQACVEAFAAQLQAQAVVSNY
eukprot:5216264-Karenia_brevis.AAC.1